MFQIIGAEWEFFFNAYFHTYKFKKKKGLSEEEPAHVSLKKKKKVWCLSLSTVRLLFSATAK